MCKHACMHACMYVCACMHACMHVCMFACMYVCTYVCTYVCMHAYMYVCIHVYVHTTKYEYAPHNMGNNLPPQHIISLCHIIIHTMSHHHTYYVTSSYILCHIIIPVARGNTSYHASTRGAHEPWMTTIAWRTCVSWTCSVTQMGCMAKGQWRPPCSPPCAVNSPCVSVLLACYFRRASMPLSDVVLVL